MFIGHFAIGLAAKKVAPSASLGTLILSAQFLDLLWPIFLLTGLEHVRISPGDIAVTPLDFYDFPLSHSLSSVLAWSLGFALIYFALRRYPKGAWVVGAGVLTHWILDAISHRPDLSLMPGGRIFVGFGLWNSLAGTLFVECGIFAVGFALYLRATRASNRLGRYGLWSLIGLLLLLYVGNLMGPPPPSVRALAIVSPGQWIFIPWCYWLDRHRPSAAAPVATP